ncbi:hypothetical protein RCL_jg26279.t1 [Rhizophagus clarus]|uniref:Uncharacterized protein n=1 Tax=Rhizophagus clarus TaxID=94130 RepID=A0A8H3QEL5_9GLOM|nr:hypothetical protein RCL_jg26279.t1 [Rhizophagus clarus]
MVFLLNSNFIGFWNFITGASKKQKFLISRLCYQSFLLSLITYYLNDIHNQIKDIKRVRTSFTPDVIHNQIKDIKRVRTSFTPDVILKNYFSSCYV